MYQESKTSTRILIHKDQVLPKLQFLVIDLNLTQSGLKTNMTTSILRTIIMMTLNLLIHKNNRTEKTLKKSKSLMM